MLLNVENLTTAFHSRGETVHAVNGVSFAVDSGQTVGIVGESGSGKSVSCYSILGLIPQPPGKIEGGRAIFAGRDLLQLSERELQAVRGRQISMIFQDPMTALNPFLRISEQLIEPLCIHEGMDPKKARIRALQELESVGIRDAGERMDCYPHEFSGGMLQRVMIAMALITRPQLLIADEPTTALDVLVQKQVLELLHARQRELQTAIILISHDLAVISSICDLVYVMYAGRVVEAAPCRELFARPLHAYTRALKKSHPVPELRGQDLPVIPGTPPNMSKPLPGCAFHPRSETLTRDHCLRDRQPELVELHPGHWVQNCPGCLGAFND